MSKVSEFGLLGYRYFFFSTYHADAHVAEANVLGSYLLVHATGKHDALLARAGRMSVALTLSGR